MQSSNSDYLATKSVQCCLNDHVWMKKEPSWHDESMWTENTSIGLVENELIQFSRKTVDDKSSIGIFFHIHTL